MTRPEDSSPTSALPLWIAVLCCAAAAFLVFGNAMPAMQDREHIERVEAEIVRLMQRYQKDIETARLSGAEAGSELDLQSLFVAIDQQGYTVAEFCAAHRAAAESDEPTTAPERGQ